MSTRAERGTFLSVLLGVNAIAITLASIALAVDRDISSIIGVVPDWFSAYVFVLLLARLAALEQIWGLKRVGVYAYFLLECVEVSMGLFVFTSFLAFPLRILIGLPAFLILLAIYFLALKPKWPSLT